MINNRRTICILGGTSTVGVTACKVLSKLGYSLRVSVRNIETIKDRKMAIKWLEGKIEMNEVIHNSYIR